MAAGRFGSVGRCLFLGVGARELGKVSEDG